MFGGKRENPAGESGHPAALGVADGLSLAAAPTFAIMALLASVFGGGPADVLCSAAHASPLGGMVPMYVLMSAFHLAPWLRLIAKAEIGGGRSVLASRDRPRIREDRNVGTRLPGGVLRALTRNQGDP